MPSYTPRFTITHAITAGLTAIERARGFMDAAKLSQAWLERMSQQALLLEAHHTTHIEGTELTLAQQRGELVIRRDVIAREHGLNERQALAVEALLDRGQLGIEELEALVPGVHRRTLQRDLRGLVDRGVAVAKGAARAARYHLKGKGS
jgi:Fic family protein